MMQTLGSNRAIVQTQRPCKTHIEIIAHTPGSCSILQSQVSCNFNLTSTGKGDIGKLLLYIYNMWWPSVLGGFLVIQQRGAQWFESSDYFFFFVIFLANLKKMYKYANFIKIYGAVQEL